VRVGGTGKLDRRAPQPLGHNFRIHVRQQQEGGGRVPQAVEANLRQARPCNCRPERTPGVVRTPEPAPRSSQKTSGLPCISSAIFTPGAPAARPGRTEAGPAAARRGIALQCPSPLDKQRFRAGPPGRIIRPTKLPTTTRIPTPTRRAAVRALWCRR
jgi:hypothetical protein